MKKSILLFLLTASLLFGQNWDDVEKIVASDRSSSDGFGNAVSVSGVYAVIGAQSDYDDENGSNSIQLAGSAYIFKYNDGTETWEQMQKIVSPDREINAYFGSSVSISGEYVIVSSTGETQDASGSNALSAAGAAYIFKLNSDSTSWDFMQKIVPDDRGQDDNFGRSVSIDGNYALIGAYLEDEDASGGSTLNNSGSAYIFELNGDGTSWSQMQKIVASDRADDDNYGFYVSLSGIYAVVAAPYEDEDAAGANNAANSGSIYVYELSSDSTSWSQMQKVVASDRDDSDYFGFSVSIAGTHLIAGALFDEDDGSGGSVFFGGSSYIFELNSDSTAWTEVQKVVATDRETTSYYGAAVSISSAGDYAVVGSYNESTDADGANSLSGAGAIYVYEYDELNTEWNVMQKVTAPVRAENDNFGASVAFYNGRIFVGANNEDEDASESNTVSGAGSAYILLNPEALPVELSAFSAAFTDGYVELVWETATEVNNYGFEVERKAGGTAWSNIGFVEGHGTVNTPYSYSFVDSDLPVVDTVSYRLKQIDLGGSYAYSKVLDVVINNSSVTGVDDEDLPSEFGLSQNYPNPFNPTTSIEYRVSSNENVSIKVYNMLGQEVMTLVNEVKSPGTYNVKMDGSQLASGIYIYQMTAGNFMSVKKFVLMK